MVRWFCPYCWGEVDERDKVYPHCGADLKGFSSLDYDQKLILALDCPITQSRIFVIEVLRRRKTQRAVSKLCRMLFEDRDTFELVEMKMSTFGIHRLGWLMVRT
jgi:hypothetical protein